MLLPYQDAIEILKQTAGTQLLPTERLPLTRCVGRTIAEPVHSPESVPPRPTSAMDGYAVSSSATAGASLAHPVDLPILGTRLAGDATPTQKKQVGAFEIMTGAILPDELFDSVIRYEDANIIEDARGRFIRISHPVSEFENVRPVASDILFGAEVFSKSSTLTSEGLMTCAALGVERLRVFRKPRVALLTTGDEIVPYQLPTLSAGMVRNTSSPYLESVLHGLGCDLVENMHIKDSLSECERHLSELLDLNIDVILTTGGVSVGKADFVRQALENLGHKIHFHKTSIRPGKPILFSECRTKYKKVVFGLPGNPLATAVGFQFFVVPYLSFRLGGDGLETLRLPLRTSFRKPKDMTYFAHGVIENLDGKSFFTPSEQQASYKVGALPRSNAWAVLPPGTECVSEFEYVDVVPFSVSSLHLSCVC